MILATRSATLTMDTNSLSGPNADKRQRCQSSSQEDANERTKVLRVTQQMHGNNIQRELGTDSLKDRVDGRDVAVEIHSRGQGRSTRAASPPSIGQSKAPTTPKPAQNHQRHQIQSQPKEITRPDPRCQVTCLSPRSPARWAWQIYWSSLTSLQWRS
jgi:hypothetical protein